MKKLQSVNDLRSTEHYSNVESALIATMADFMILAGVVLVFLL
ncbi:hypothetical protein [Alteromonas macleodii]|nr:hypothetical protein [Alteromonas macleodii]